MREIRKVTEGGRDEGVEVYTEGDGGDEVFSRSV